MSFIHYEIKKEKINIETEEDDFVWPFLEPPKKPRSVFDTGPTREEVGEFNRRIFAAYTEYLDSDKDKILFSYNPNFSDEESCDIEEHDIVSNLYKSEIELFLYNGTEFIHQDKCIIKIFINNLSEKIVHINSMKYKFSFESDSILVYEFFEDVKVDILNLNDLHIYRLVFVDCRHCKKFNFVYNAK
ncbi:hypothetical protein NAPIS_ORF00754 [Vairimorpha apis BRL 01]|uniref:Uncharacterized protein n=1 Tax=Vairimorpha apis BRL 01 TaxID=1037528 RepID=T0MKZ0_9MICR|nr:hypothetical protein NAPIS_ORF00754 [Vairimorpha apis BRL 01]